MSVWAMQLDTGKGETMTKGDNKLWGWFGLSHASFLTLPRVLMHEMSEEWQNKMATLLVEYEETYPNQPDIGTRVQATRSGKLTKFPEYLLNYRHPQRDEIGILRRQVTKP